jgi:tetratricopeptide (TPR) repeat protein
MKMDGSASRFRQSWLICGVGLLCAVLIKPVQDGFESRMGKPEPEPDLLYFSSPKALKVLALGYDSLLADFYWMRAIQYYGRREEAYKRQIPFKNLYTLFDITTTLDPNLMDAYHTGAAFLAEPEPVGAGQQQEALKLLDKGIAAHPQDWRLYYDKGFIHYLFLHNYQTAGELFLQASKFPAAPDWIASFAAYSLSKGGSVEVAIALWQRQYREASRADLKENARNHLLSFKVAQDLGTLEELIDRFKAKTGNYPKSLQDLMRTQKHSYTTTDPLGTPYEYIPMTGAVTLSPDSKVKYQQVPDEYKRQLRITIDE